MHEVLKDMKSTIVGINEPTVSIALPVYNGENYLQDAIRSVLGQSFQDLELLLLDNASTDATEKICRAAVAQDRRVRYFRAEVNGGLAWNHNRAVELAKGRYLMWTAHDDALCEHYVKRCVEALDQDPGAVLAFTNTQIIDANGERLSQFSNQCDNKSPSSRFRSLMRGETCCDAVFGLMKMETLKRTGLHGYFAGSDLVLLGELALHGRFILIPEFCYLRRHHPLVTSSPARTSREVTLIFDPRKAGKIFLPYFLTAGGFLAAIARARPSWKERLACYKYLSSWLWMTRRDLYFDCVEPVAGALKRHLSEDEVERLKTLRNWLLRRTNCKKKSVTSNS